MNLPSDQSLIVSRSQRNGVFICKRYHSEFAGPGAAVGGLFDQDYQQVIPVGNFSLTAPESGEEKHKALLIRRQWIRLFKQITNDPVPLQRAKIVLTHFEHYFGRDVLAQIPDEVLANLVGVFPQTMRAARQDWDISV